jgi:hypothetical protein
MSAGRKSELDTPAAYAGVSATTFNTNSRDLLKSTACDLFKWRLGRALSIGLEDCDSRHEPSRPGESFVVGLARE